MSGCPARKLTWPPVNGKKRAGAGERFALLEQLAQSVLLLKRSLENFLGDVFHKAAFDIASRDEMRAGCHGLDVGLRNRLALELVNAARHLEWRQMQLHRRQRLVVRDAQETNFTGAGQCSKHIRLHADRDEGRIHLIPVKCIDQLRVLHVAMLLPRLHQPPFAPLRPKGGFKAPPAKSNFLVVSQTRSAVATFRARSI